MTSLAKGRFITFEGGEGCGKTTQIKLLSEALTARGIPHLLTREPGGTVLAERIRPLVVEPSGTAEDWHPLAETLLFLAARLQHWQEKIKPALDAGQWVLCDRFMDSTLVYQGIGKGLGVEYLQSLHRFLNGQEWLPHLTFLLDIEPSAGLSRAAGRAGKETRFEDLDIQFHHKIRAGFLKIAGKSPERVKVIEAAQPLEEVHRLVSARLFQR